MEAGGVFLEQDSARRSAGEGATTHLFDLRESSHNYHQVVYRRPLDGFHGRPACWKMRYFHQCPICSELLEELTKAQVEAVKGN
jgi:hypothetical protein